MLGGIIVTFTSWRIIFWLQTGLAGLATVGCYFLLPETIHHRSIDDLAGRGRKDKARAIARLINPWRVIRLFEYPNLFLCGIASSALVWNMYSLLTPIRYVLNPRYHLSSPLLGGLFYLAPGTGYLAGTLVGGRFADYVVRRYAKRRGYRRPEDRLYSCLPFIGLLIPASMVVYGWSVERDAGGIPLTVVVLFAQGVGQLFCFPSLNTYCLDVMPGRSADVIAGNYFIRFLFACVGTAVVLPAVNAFGVGWFSTISAAFLLLAAAGTYLSVRCGERWRNQIDEKHRAKEAKAKTKTKEKEKDGAVAPVANDKSAVGNDAGGQARARPDGATLSADGSASHRHRTQESV